MPNAPYAVPSRSTLAARSTRSLLVVLLALTAPIGCVTTRVIERPADATPLPPAPDPLPEPPAYRTVGDGSDAAWWDAHRDAPDVRVWMASDGVLQRGQRARALFRVREDGYVTVVRLDTDGRLRVLYPRTPYDDAFVRGGQTYRVPGYDNASFLVDDATGVGYVFVISSYRPFDYTRYALGNRWDQVALVNSRVYGDPLPALRAFAERIAPDVNTGYATDYAEYYVDRRVDYPRYAFPDCYEVRVGVVYDPYDTPCTRYRVVIYEDSYYYPYRYYPGTRVVYAPRPRYEHKPVVVTRPGSTQPPVWVEHRRRPVDVDPKRRPTVPATNPNGKPGRVANGNPGATRPGDDVQPNNGGGRRRPDDAGRPADPHYGAGVPRRDSARVTPSVPTPNGGNGNGGNPGSGNGGNVGQPGNGNGGSAANGRGPRTDPATTRDGGHDNGRGRGDGEGRDDKRRAPDDTAAVVKKLLQARERAHDARPTQPTQNAPTDTHVAEPPRAEPPRAEPPRSDDHGAASRPPRQEGEEPRRAEPPTRDDHTSAPATDARPDASDDHARPSETRTAEPKPSPRRGGEAKSGVTKSTDARSADTKSDDSKGDDRRGKAIETRRRTP